MDHSEIKHLPKVDHTPAELDEASKGILRIADVIDQYGHAQNDIGNCERGFCITGALLHAFPGYSYSSSVVDRLSKAFGGARGWLDFNNAPGRTKDEVVAKLRAVALLHRD